MSTSAPIFRTGVPTVWGLTPIQLHDRFWASRGVQVVRRGGTSEFVESAELYLLTDPDTLVIFRLRDLVEALSWLRPQLLIVRLRDESHHEYREVIRSDASGDLQGIDRIYEGLGAQQARVGLTPSREVARTWQDATSARAGWQELRRSIDLPSRQTRRVPGRVFDARREDQLAAHLDCLMDSWTRPSATVPRVVRGPAGIWADRDAHMPASPPLAGNVWIGAGRQVDPEAMLVGPAILWDAPEARPIGESVPWGDLEPLPALAGRALPIHRGRSAGKRAFDIVFSLVALALTLPLYPIIALAILIEDGWPVLFIHKRETLGGRQFPCLKFRSMRRDAERSKVALAGANRSDGPQFFVADDPRTTRIGAIMRKTQIDELPQFFNVLVGHMSVVGPRPSPRRENQYCPPWRESRLSVRPGVTGLWQVCRTRAKGLDFQEWIRFDLEYVERMNWRLDLWIIWQTIRIVIRLGR